MAQPPVKLGAVFEHASDSEDELPDPQFMCQICHDIVQIPCQLKCPLKSDCGAPLICLDCVRTYSELSKPPRERKEFIKCLLCSSNIVAGKIANANNTYEVNQQLFPFINAKFDLRASKCRRCNQQCTSQRHLWNHKLKECPESWIPCNHVGTDGYKCRFWGYRKDMDYHKQQEHAKILCPVCNYSIKKKLFRGHILGHQEEQRKRHLNVSDQYNKTKVQFEYAAAQFKKSCDLNEVISKLIAEEEKAES
tara:strand:- start:3315 stop:4064 length:750 start_codon:yes stop_codon:yes gene_type:complete